MNLLSSHHFAILTLFAITNYHIPIYWMICFIPFVRLSFPFLLWRWVIYFRLREHGGCDRLAEDAYFSLAPDPTSGIASGPWKPDFYYEFRWHDLDTLFVFADCSVTWSWHTNFDRRLFRLPKIIPFVCNGDLAHGGLWPVSRGRLLLHDSWFYLRICGGLHCPISILLIRMQYSI
jgi:hypothetical protein